MNFMAFHILGIIIPTDELICFKMLKTTNQHGFAMFFLQFLPFFCHSKMIRKPNDLQPRKLQISAANFKISTRRLSTWQLRRQRSHCGKNIVAEPCCFLENEYPAARISAVLCPRGYADVSHRSCSSETSGAKGGEGNPR